MLPFTKSPEKGAKAPQKKEALLGAKGGEEEPPSVWFEEGVLGFVSGGLPLKSGAFWLKKKKKTPKKRKKIRFRGEKKEHVASSGRLLKGS